MLERVRAAARPPEPDPPGPDHKPRRPARTPAYVILPLAMLATPPVRHRGASDDGTLNPFDLRVLCAVLAAARQLTPTGRHQDALRAGQHAMMRARVRRFATNKKIKKAGRQAYQRGRQTSTPDRVVVQARRSALLVAAGMSAGRHGLSRVDAALDRLTRSIAGLPDRLGPVVAEWRVEPSGKLAIQVRGPWLWLRGGYRRVPMPLPKARGANVLALYLFVVGLDMDASSDSDIAVAKLYQRLGIATDCDRHDKRAFDDALGLVNAYLATLDREALAHFEVRIPAMFVARPVAGGTRIRIAPQWARPAEPRRQPIKRRRLKGVGVAAPDEAALADGREALRRESAPPPARRGHDQKQARLEWDQRRADGGIDDLAWIIGRLSGAR